MTRYDWSKLDAGWRLENGQLTKRGHWISVKTLESGAALESGYDLKYIVLWREALDQLAKCRVRPKYDWSKLDAGWRWNLFDLLLKKNRRFSVPELEANPLPPLGCDSEYRGLWHEAKAQLAKCRVRDREQQRKHEATHGWRNPPCIYE